jgi:hypothetical protein
VTRVALMEVVADQPLEYGGIARDRKSNRHCTVCGC